MEIRQRLTFLFTILVGIILLIFSLVIYISSVQHRQKEFESRLKLKALTTANLLVGKKEIDHTFLKEVDARDLTVLHEEEVMILNFQNQVIYDSGEDTLAINADFIKLVRKRKEVIVKEGNRGIIGLLYQANGNNYVVLASAIDRYGYNQLENLRIVLSIGWFVAISVIIFSGWIFSKNALNPISEMIQRVDEISFSNLKSRLEAEKGKDEIALLAKTFNRMLGRLEKSVESQKSFISHASHELRTPLTTILGEVQVSLTKDRSVEEYKKVLASVNEEVKILADLSNSLLELARVTGDVSSISKKLVRVDEILWQAREELLKKSSKYKVDIDFEFVNAEDELTISGNESLLKTAFLNLMENACKFSGDFTVKIQISTYLNLTKIDFSDKGIGIPEEDLPLIFTPYFRSSNAYTVKGYGIGLPLIQKIIFLHEAQIEVVSQIGKGSTFTLSFHR